AEIDRQFQAALSAEQILKATPVETWDDLLVKGTMPDELRPSLYDFIAHEALEFYTSAEQAGARPEGSFELCADSPVLDAADAFIAWRPETGGETNASVLRAVALYQDLLRFHQGDAPPKLAFAHADLEGVAGGWSA